MPLLTRYPTVLGKKVLTTQCPEYLGQGGSFLRHPYHWTSPSAVLHWAHWVTYLAAQTCVVTPSKREGKTDEDQLLPQTSHWESLSEPSTTSRAPDAVLRELLTYCCLYVMNSIVLWFVIFFRNENNPCTHTQGSQCHLQTNTPLAGKELC